MSLKKNKQKDQAGYNEGYRTGMSKGYKKGIEDAVMIVQGLLADHGIHMEASEFYLEMQALKDDGDLVTPDGIEN